MTAEPPALSGGDPAGFPPPDRGTFSPPDRVIDPAGGTAAEIALLVAGVPGVVRLHGGLFGEVATYLPGRRVPGVKLGADGVQVHVVLADNVPIRMTAERVHAVVSSAVDGPVHVVVEDIEPPAIP